MPDQFNTKVEALKALKCRVRSDERKNYRIYKITRYIIRYVGK